MITIFKTFDEAFAASVGYRQSANKGVEDAEMKVFTRVRQVMAGGFLVALVTSDDTWIGYL